MAPKIFLPLDLLSTWRICQGSCPTLISNIRNLIPDSIIKRWKVPWQNSSKSIHPDLNSRMLFKSLLRGAFIWYYFEVCWVYFTVSKVVVEDNKVASALLDRGKLKRKTTIIPLEQIVPPNIDPQVPQILWYCLLMLIFRGYKRLCH